jgi:hypothetical protein
MTDRKATSTRKSKYREQQVLTAVEIIRKDIREIGDYVPVGYDRANHRLWKGMYGIKFEVRDLALEVLIDAGEFELEVHSDDGRIARRIAHPTATS